MVLAWLLAPPLPESVPRQRLLYHRLREAIIASRLPPGLRLPSSRGLAASLGVARNTVLFAYEQLIAEGFLVANRQGTRVSPLACRSAAGAEGVPVSCPALSRRAAGLPDLAPEPQGEALLFASGAPDFSAFPFRAWRASLDRAWRDAGWRQLGYAGHGGEVELRRALADYLAGARGLAVTAEQIVITNGSQTALDLCARLFADHGETVWVENPGYPAARAAFELAGLEVHDVAVDAEGMAPGEQDWLSHPPRLLMLTPSHQYPSGCVMSLARRRALIEGARDCGAWIIEDDYDSEFRRVGPAPPALFGLRPGASVVYVGTFSKTLYPGLRLGYLVLPQAIAVDFARVASLATRAGQGIEQRALADFIRRGAYTAHLRRMRRLYAARQARLRAALEQSLSADLDLSGGEAGLHLVLRLPEAIRDVEVSRRARELGLGVRPLSRYARTPVRCNGLLLSYGNLDEGAIEEGVRRLAVAIRAVERGAFSMDASYSRRDDCKV